MIKVSTVISQLPIGTRFWVHNGHWTGNVVEKEGVKQLLVEETNEYHVLLDSDLRALQIDIYMTGTNDFLEIKYDDSNKCCTNEKRDWDGWCINCGDPCW